MIDTAFLWSSARPAGVGEIRWNKYPPKRGITVKDTRTVLFDAVSHLGD